MICLVGLLVPVHASPVSPPMVAGHVRLADGSPVAGAQVVLFDVADLTKGPVGQATTDEAGQFALPLAASGALVLPQGFALGPNYPNPFNPSTIIPYQLASPAPVRLEVFNILGQHMATLVDEEQATGSYRARWRSVRGGGLVATDWPAGWLLARPGRLIAGREPSRRRPTKKRRGRWAAGQERSVPPTEMCWWRFLRPRLGTTGRITPTGSATSRWQTGSA